MNRIIKLAMVFLTFFFNPLTAQCSDAGVCSVNLMPAETKSGNVEALYRLGFSGKDDDIYFHNLELSGGYDVYDDINVYLRLPIRYIDGPLGSNSGIGDLVAMIGFNNLIKLSDFSVGLKLGARLETGNTNGGTGLPQAYQAGLGTNDLIIGLQFHNAAFSFSAGYQLVPESFTENEATPIERGDDLYFQAGYTHAYEEIKVRFELQAIQRVQATRIKAPDGTIATLTESDKLQINLGAEGIYPYNSDINLRFGFAMPVLARDINVDGLKRTFTTWFGTSLLF